MRSYTKHLIETGTPVKSALERLDALASDAILFVVDSKNKLIGSLTDGDVRRGLLEGFTIEDKVDQIIQSNPKFIRKGNFDFNTIIEYRKKNIDVIPVIDKENIICNIVNFRHLRSYLPVDAVIMAGGRGSRLRPLTDEKPKPLLNVGEKPIIEHNIDRLALYGIDDFWISIKYLGEQIVDYFGDGNHKGVHIEYVSETVPLGTIGSVSLIDSFKHDHILLTNSDILTNLDYEHFYLEFLEKDADLSVVTIPYKVNVPYAVLETSEKGLIHDFKEKPTYTYFSNGGIYLMKKSVINLIPKEEFYNATDLMETMIKKGLKVVSYPLMGYWLDVGKPEDYKKAQEDIDHIKM